MSNLLEIFLRPVANITLTQKTKCAIYLIEINNMQMTNANVSRMLAILTELELHNPEQYRSLVYSALTSRYVNIEKKYHEDSEYGNEAHMYWTR